jgi:kinesin family protein 13
LVIIIYNNTHTDNFVGTAPDHHNFRHYPEPPEPIIEIIIQDNNETLPEPQPYIQNNGNKKKEQVQVFYVKYHKDEHKGLVIHDPVAALSPAGHEQHDDEGEEDLTIVTPVPNIPRKSTTLRTIIRPESEQYESSSGVHVTFNKPHNHHSKSDNHIHDEEKVESAIQPVIQLPNRGGSFPLLPVKEKRQQPQFWQGPHASVLNQGRIVNGQVQSGNFQHHQQNNVQPLPHQRPPVEFNSQNNFIAHSHQPFLSNQLTLPSQESSKPFHPNAQFNHNNHHHQQPISIPINHHQNQQGVLGHQQQFNQRLPPLQGPTTSQTQQTPLLKPPQRAPAPPVSFNQNQRPFNYHAHSSQAQQPPPQNIQRPQQISPPHHQLPSQNFHNSNQQALPFNRPPVQFNTQFPIQQSQPQFSSNQGPPLNFKPFAKIVQFPTNPPHNHPVQNQPHAHNSNVFQGGLVEQAAPNLAVKPVQYQQLPQQALPPSFQNSQPQKDIHFNQQKFIQSTFGTDVQVSSSVPKFEHHITETVNPPVFFQPTALDMDKLQHHGNDKNIGPLVGKIGNLMVTQKPLLQHRFAPQQANNNFSPQDHLHFQTPKNNFLDINPRNNFVTSTIAPLISTTLATTTTKRIEKVQQTSSTTAKPQAYYQLPDEIPDDLRKQLEESGVLDNAQISILDYDKIGDTPLQDLPPEHLANFFSAGGGAQIGANSNKVIQVLKPNGESVGNQIKKNKDFLKLIGGDVNGKSKKEDVNLRVVKFDMQQKLPEVSAKTQNYSRYLPVKINAEQFPISGIEEIRGKKVVSVVVLAPVAKEDDSSGENNEKETFEAGQIKFLNGESLKNLIKKPSTENFKRFFEHEQKTVPDFLQSVVLLVTK